jgi:hypothetical protein
MTDQLLSDLLEDAGSRIPVGPAPHAAILARATRRRRLRTMRWLAVGMVATATAALVAVGVTQVGDDSGGSGIASSPIESFTQARVTYAAGSTIHYGDQSIDVSPHQIMAFVQTDDGFVFVDQDFEVNVTDGTGVEEIGHTEGFWGDLVLAADDTGSYVGWIDVDEAIVYDTAKGAEVLRAPVPWGEGGYRAMAAIDGNLAYVQGDGVGVWDLTTQTKPATIMRSDPRDLLGDVARGYYLWHHVNGTSVVSRNPDAEQPVFNKIIGEDEDQLSPDAGYVSAPLWLFERATQQDITPRDTHPLPQATLQWLDNDRYVADTDNMHYSSPDPDPHDLLICTASIGTCRVVVESLGYITYPNGIANEGAWEN